MDPTAFRADDEAVSPVVSVVLMVAIVVALAALVGPVALGVGERVSKGEPAPQASLVWTYDADVDELTLTHQGGENLAVGNLRVVVSGTDVTTSGAVTWNHENNRTLIASGTVVVSGVSSDDTVRVFWVDPDPEADRQDQVALWNGDR
jgi:flagellin-like protein